MEKYICPVCGKELGLTSIKSKIVGGYICSTCLAHADIPLTSDLKGFSEQEAVELIRRRTNFGKFHATKRPGGLKFEVDENKELFKIGGHIYEYSNLLSFQLYQNGGSVSTTGLGRAVGGGILFGPVGAIVGGVTGKKKTANTCFSLKIEITLRNTFNGSETLKFIDTSEKKALETNSKDYKKAMKEAQECLSALQIIHDKGMSYQQNQSLPHYEEQARYFEEHSRVDADQEYMDQGDQDQGYIDQGNTDQAQAPEPQPASSGTGTSAADEIRKYKELLDDGIITQEEFDAKKKQLLGL